MAVSGCRVTNGVRNACGDLLFPAGADGDFWVGYVSDLSVPFSVSQSAVISSIGLGAYAGLVRFSSQKFTNNGSWEWVKGAGGTGFFRQTFATKLIALSVQDDVEVQRLLQSIDAFVINRNNNGSYLIYGAQNGLTAIPGAVGTTGTADADDVSDTVTLQGAEKTKPLRFLVTDEATTKAYLEARTLNLNA